MIAERLKTENKEKNDLFILSEKLKNEKKFLRERYQECKEVNEKQEKKLFELEKFKKRFENPNDKEEEDIQMIKRNFEIKKQNDLFQEIILIKNAKHVILQKENLKIEKELKKLRKKVNNFEKNFRETFSNNEILKKENKKFKNRIDIYRMKYKKLKLNSENKNNASSSQINNDLSVSRSISINENSLFNKNNRSFSRFIFGEDRLTTFDKPTNERSRFTDGSFYKSFTNNKYSLRNKKFKDN